MNEGHRKSVVTLAILIVLAIVIGLIYYFTQGTKAPPVITDEQKQAAIDSLTAPKATTQSTLTPEQKKAINSLSAPIPKSTDSSASTVTPPSKSVLDSLSAPQ